MSGGGGGQAQLRLSGAVVVVRSFVFSGARFSTQARPVVPVRLMRAGGYRPNPDVGGYPRRGAEANRNGRDASRARCVCGLDYGVPHCTTCHSQRRLVHGSDFYPFDPQLFRQEIEALPSGSWVVVDEIQKLPFTPAFFFPLRACSLP